MEVRDNVFWAILALSITTINAQDCTEGACIDIDPDVSNCEWTNWGPCSTTCGPGERVRQHQQEASNGGEPCIGNNTMGCPNNPDCK